MANNEIEIIEDRPNGHRLKLILSDNQLNKLGRLKDYGGFKRFDIDYYDDNSKMPLTQNSTDKINKFLKNVGIDAEYSHGGTITSAWQNVVNWFNSPI